MNTIQLAGLQVVETVMQGHVEGFQRLYLLKDTRNKRLQQLEKQARKAGVQIQPVDKERLEKMMPGTKHQGVIADYLVENLKEEGDIPALVEQAGQKALFLVLDGVQDPHNLGACMRSAEAAGVTAVIVPKDRAADLTAVARRAGCGGAELVPLIRVTNLARTLRQLKDLGVWLAGTTDDAHATIHQQDLTGPLALVMGSEGEGMRRLTSEQCDYHLSIPMLGHVSSLNVSVATGVCLFEIVRQRG